MIQREVTTKQTPLSDYIIKSSKEKVVLILERRMRQVVSSLRHRAARVVSALPPLVPPLEFPCRIEPLPEGSADIDNDMYGDDALARSWHSPNQTKELATLHLLNAARIPYFDRIWVQQLGLSPDRPGNFLEIGCGGGVATCALASRGYIMTGVDPAEASLEEAREHARKLGLQSRVLFAPGTAYDLSGFPSESFQGIVMADVLEHLYDLPAAIEQVWRCLQPGGVLVFDTINRTYASYVLAIALAQEGLGVVPPRTHDWRLFIKVRPVEAGVEAGVKVGVQAGVKVGLQAERRMVGVRGG